MQSVGRNRDNMKKVMMFNAKMSACDFHSFARIRPTNEKSTPFFLPRQVWKCFKSFRKTKTSSSSSHSLLMALKRTVRKYGASLARLKKYILINYIRKLLAVSVIKLIKFSPCRQTVCVNRLARYSICFKIIKYMAWHGIGMRSTSCDSSLL